MKGSLWLKKCFFYTSTLTKLNLRLSRNYLNFSLFDLNRVTGLWGKLQFRTKEFLCLVGCRRAARFIDEINASSCSLELSIWKFDCSLSTTSSYVLAFCGDDLLTYKNKTIYDLWAQKSRLLWPSKGHTKAHTKSYQNICCVHTR